MNLRIAGNEVEFYVLKKPTYLQTGGMSQYIPRMFLMSRLLMLSNAKAT